MSYMLCAAHCACACACAGKIYRKLLTGNTGSFCEQQPLKAKSASRSLRTYTSMWI
jgi:hypothetical protein